MTMFKVRRGVETQLPSEISNGTMYFCTDTGNIYIDMGNQRKQISGEKALKDSAGNVIVDTYATLQGLNTKSSIKILTSTSEELLQTLKIYHLSQEEYDQKVADGTIEDDALYIKPGEAYYTRPEVDELLSTKASTIPTFDINEMGFPDITKKNELLVTDTIDVSALRDALGKGPVKILYTVKGKQYGEVVSGGGYLDDLIYNIELRSYGKIFIGVAETAIIGGWVSDIPSIDIQEDNGKIIAVENGEYVLKYPKDGVSSWNDLTDKPFGDGIEIVIDPATFKPTDVFEQDGIVVCSLTDQITTKEDVLGATLSGTIGGQNLSLQFTQDDITFEDDNILIAFIQYEGMELPIFVAAAAGTYTIQTGTEPVTVTVPNKGFYTLAEVLEVFTSISLTKPIKKIDEKYLPEISSYTETDPTVPAWAKAETKPSYTAAEVGTYTKAEIDNLELITEEEIDEIANSNIENNTRVIDFTYDGDDVSDAHTWVTNTADNRAFVKVADIPDGEINLVGGHVNVTHPLNTTFNYSFEITEDMLEASVDHFGWILHAKVNGLTQIFYQHELDASLVAVVVICTKPGIYAVSFNGWGEELTFTETGIYFMDNRSYGGNKYTAMMTCTVTSAPKEIEENPIRYNGYEIQVFNRGLCIGDSITEGVFNHDSGEAIIKKYSYPSLLKRITGIDIVNAGVAGLTSKTWYDASLNSGTQWGRWVNDEWVWSESPDVGESDKVSTALDYSGYDFAIIHLGINDLGLMGDATLDTTISTFETNINNIINKLKTANTGIKVFLCTIIPSYAVPGNTNYATLNEKIREIANRTQDVFLIDLNEYSECRRNTPYSNGHLTAIGYQKMATEIKSLISHTIKGNLNKFNMIQFIGTSYTD